MNVEPEIGGASYSVEWHYIANDGRKAERYGPYLLQAELVHAAANSRDPTQRKRIALGVISVELINEVSQRHSFWVITEAALDSLELDAARRDQICAELSKIVPLPIEGEIVNQKNKFSAFK